MRKHVSGSSSSKRFYKKRKRGRHEKVLLAVDKNCPSVKRRLAHEPVCLFGDLISDHDVRHCFECAARSKAPDEPVCRMLKSVVDELMQEHVLQCLQQNNCACDNVICQKEKHRLLEHVLVCNESVVECKEQLCKKIKKIYGL